jgi:hypothetical protein
MLGIVNATSFCYRIKERERENKTFECKLLEFFLLQQTRMHFALKKNLKTTRKISKKMKNAYHELKVKGTRMRVFFKETF